MKASASDGRTPTNGAAAGEAKPAGKSP